MFKRQTDLRPHPVKWIIALGESTTWVYTASAKEKCWVNYMHEVLYQHCEH